MLKKYIGKSRAENLDWLVNVWLKDGPPLCFLQGFSGVGKTDLARDVREMAEKQQSPDGKPKWQQAVINEIADRATPSVIESLMELSVTLSRQGLPEMERILFEQKDPNLAFALEKALERPVVIILDEAERFFRGETGAPLPEMNGILSFLRNRQNLPGRLLLLSDRIVEEARWSEWIPKRTLSKLEPDEAVEALDTKLSETELTVDIPLERKKEVVRDLDFNPRAIEALVAALRYESLDEIIGSNPGLWATHDREVSRDFLKALERDLLERTMRHINDVHQRRLWRLAVHRRSFKREAVEKLCGTKDEANDLRSILVTHYLLNFYKGALSLNPIVREISLNHLRDEVAEFKQAHSGAADYHLRHFKAKQIVGSQAQLGESFAELRYHLVMAGRESELGVIGQRFTDHLKQELKSVSPVPTNAEELDERIGVLTALLENAGAKGLEYHLARCLQTRGKAGDIQQAVIHAERALGHGAPEAAWYLLAKLKWKAEGAEAAIAIARRGILELENPDLTAPLYQLGAEILNGANKTDEAVALLKEGIAVPGMSSLSQLYQLCAELMARAGKIEGEEGAVALLKEGIALPGISSLSQLYQSCAELLAKVGKTDEAVALLKEGIAAPEISNLSQLYQSCAELLAKVGKTDDAVALLKEGIAAPEIPNLSQLYRLCAELLAKVGKTDEAVALLKGGIKDVPPNKNLFWLYQIGADLLANVSKTDEAVALLKEGISVIPPDVGLSALFETMSEVLCRVGRISDAIASQREGMRRVPVLRGGHRLAEAALTLAVGSGDNVQFREITSELTATKAMKHQELLSEVLGLEVSGDWSQAQKAAAKARIQAPAYFALGLHEALCHLAQGDSEGALRSLPVFPSEATKQGQTQWWLVAFVHLRRGSRPEASAALESYFGRPVDEARELNEAFLLRLWDQQEFTPESHRLCFHFPIMPASLTGLGHSVHRVEFGKPVLPTQAAPGTAAHVPVSPATAPSPEIYVSYAWGEDSSDSGRQREEIVDRLCDTVKRSGRVIGRDKNRMRGGDSIERFAHEISKAKRIVAVISEKSLNSEFCMAHELFRAFRRCDYQRVEFQEKVIAVVMDDAKPLLRDNFALLALAKAWQDRMEKLRAELQSVDPARKSPALWLFVDLMEEMCPRLPDMFGALKDIVMKRGFEEITDDGFAEIITRLPPLTG